MIGEVGGCRAIGKRNRITSASVIVDTRWAIAWAMNASGAVDRPGVRRVNQRLSGKQTGDDVHRMGRKDDHGHDDEYGDPEPHR